VLSKDKALPTSLCSKEININEEINIMMDGTISEEFDGYKCCSSNDANNENNLKIFFLNFMSEGMNEEGNGEQ
jgi:hypothetical protein